ncbi:hypothetical protein MMC30_008056 [Trapelia coarctata]|nr:hypothetical protein [Trapelia coarctata]
MENLVTGRVSKGLGPLPKRKEWKELKDQKECKGDVDGSSNRQLSASNSNITRYTRMAEIIQGSEVLTRYIPRPTVLNISAFTLVAGMGASIGPENASGTMGGYVLLSKPGEADKLFALTCHHVTQTAIIPVAHNENCTIDAASANIDIEIKSPSPMDVEQSAATQETNAHGYDVNIERGEQKLAMGISDTGTLQQLATNQAKQDRYLRNAGDMRNFNNNFGKVTSGSGLRKDDDDFALDWALIQPRPERVTSNLIPEVEDFHGTGWTPDGKIVTITDVSCLTVTDPNHRVFKKGRTTGMTWGLVNAIKTDIHVQGDPEDVIYTAWDIVPPPRGSKNFSESGDSGSWVLDKDGSLCGMLCAGSNPELGQGLGKSHGFVIPIDRVFADIEHITGSKVSLPLEVDTDSSFGRPSSRLTGQLGA